MALINSQTSSEHGKEEAPPEALPEAQNRTSWVLFTCTQNLKTFKITCHIKSLYACMKY